MRTVSITEFRTDLSRILDEAERGVVYRITRRGVPVARIERFATGDHREVDAARRTGAAREAAVDGFIAERATWPRTGMTLEEILAARREGMI